MENRTIRKGFEAFEWKFEPLEKDLKNSNGNSNHSKGIRSIRMEIRTIQKIVRSIRIQIRTIRKGFEALKSKFDSFKRDLKLSNGNSNQ